MQTDARPRVEAARFALVILPSALVALPFALAGFAQVRALLPVATANVAQRLQRSGNVFNDYMLMHSTYDAPPLQMTFNISGR